MARLLLGWVGPRLAAASTYPRLPSHPPWRPRTGCTRIRYRLGSAQLGSTAGKGPQDMSKEDVNWEDPKAESSAAPQDHGDLPLSSSSSPPPAGGDVESEELKEPEEPGPSECCGNSCNDCVWIEYWEAMQDYKAKKAALEQQRLQHEEQLGSSSKHST